MINPFDAGGYSLAEMTTAINILPNVYTRLSPPDSVLSKCRRLRHPIPTQIATAPSGHSKVLLS
jgi:hypothetical protein